MKYPQLMSRVFREPWLITPQKHEAIARVLLAHVAGVKSGSVMEDSDEEDDGRREVQDINGTRIIPVHGILGKHLSMIEEMCGGCSMDAVTEQIDLAKYDSNVARVVFDFRTPGGTVTGTPELAQEIADLGKPTIAFTDTECCSGGLWLASQCDEWYATPSCIIGSCGVYLYLEDHTRAMEMDGIKPEPVSAGKFKLAGAYFKPFTPEERAIEQAAVDQIHVEFKEAVNIKRPVADEYLQGQTFRGKEAVQFGFLSGLVGDLEECLEIAEAM